MISLLQEKQRSEHAQHRAGGRTFLKYGISAVASCFLAYMSYYIVRNNFALSTPYLKQHLSLTSTQIGLLSSVLLISYGLSKGFMSALADKASPRKYLAMGLACCALVNLAFVFTTGLWEFVILLALLGLFQGTGAAPAYITMANWFPKRLRGRVGALWNISHNIGGGIVAPVITAGIVFFGVGGWQYAVYVLPAMLALAVVPMVLVLGKDSPRAEGFTPLEEDPSVHPARTPMPGDEAHPGRELSTWQIFRRYVLPNKSAWYTAMVDACVYVIRFGMVSWMPLYLTEYKHFSMAEMSVAFLLFEWAAIPSTLLAGWISDTFFKGQRMPLAIISTLMIIVCIVGYWKATSVVSVVIFTAMIGCLIYIPQFLASVQGMEIVPSFAVGSMTGLRGFMSYIVGATAGTTLIGIAVDRMGWDGGIMVLFGGSLLCVLFCILAHIQVLKMNRRQVTPASTVTDTPTPVSRTTV